MARTKVGGEQSRCQDECQARCCRYITVQIDAPKRKIDLDELSWFLAHEHITVYVESRRWHVEMRTRCKYLTADNLCAVYETRPEVCRNYQTSSCEYPARPKHTLEFDQREDFDAWRAKQREVRKLKRAARARGR
jgi:Fe-S-cluster containining protein